MNQQPSNMKNFTNLIIIDASESMESKKSEVIGGLKQLFKDIKKEATNDVNTTTIVVDFSDSSDFRVLVNSNNPKDLTEKLASSYDTRGWTALYDAIGKAFKLVPKKQDGVFVSILTDGDENSSRKYKAPDIKTLIEKKRAKKWGITFMGTTEEQLSKAQDLGISRGNMFSFADSGAGVNTAMKMSGVTRSAYYSTATSSVGLDGLDTDNLITDVQTT